MSRSSKGDQQPTGRCRVEEEVPNPSPPKPVAKVRATRSQSRPPRLSPTGHPNYISQDENDEPPTARCTTRLTSTSIMQETMLSCVDVYKPRFVLSADLGILNFAATPKLTGKTYTVTPQQMSARRIALNWFCEMANLVVGDNGKLLEYRHLISNHKTRSIWTHSYGNEIG